MCENVEIQLYHTAITEYLFILKFCILLPVHIHKCFKPPNMFINSKNKRVRKHLAY